MPERCRICNVTEHVYRMSVDVGTERRARGWRVTVCRDCWRAFEAMLDQGATTRQDDLFSGDQARWKWFV